jgi:hypothetical protein
VAELTPLDVKLGEVLGLAQAAQDATREVAKLAEHHDSVRRLETMRAEEAETERRTLALLDRVAAKRGQIEAKGAEARSSVRELMRTYLGEHSDEVTGFAFLTMAEAGELGRWEIVRELSERSGDHAVLELAEWAITVQERHKIFVRECSLELAAEEAASADLTW